MIEEAAMQLEHVRQLGKKLYFKKGLAEAFGLDGFLETPRFGIGVGLTDEEGKYRLAVRVPNEEDAKWFRKKYANELQGVDLDLKVVGELNLPQASDTASPPAAGVGAVQSLTIGMPVRHVNGHAGTLGFFARRNGTQGFVSCNHVLVHNDMFKQGAEVHGVIPNDVIGRLSAATKLRFFPKADCAFAVVTNGRFPANPGLVNGTPLSTMRPVLTTSLVVRKFGQKTQQTVGKITAFGISQDFHYQEGFAVTFTDVIEIESTAPPAPPFNHVPTFADPGDSGSLVYTEDMKPVGLLFFEKTGGPDNSGLSYAHPLQAVEKALNVTLLS